MSLRKRRATEYLFKKLCFSLTLATICLLIILLYSIISTGYSWVDAQFLSSLPSRKPEKAGIYTAIYGSLWLLSITAAFALPIGVATAIYLEEYASKNKFSKFIDVNISNLAGVPSIVYGLLGLVIFVHTFGFGRSVLSGGLTLGLLVLPVIIIASRGAIKAVPDSISHAAYALGARKWQVVIGQILPYSLPGIMTGVIISLSRAIGETAPLIIIGAATYVAFIPESPLDEFTALPIQIFNWTSRPQEDFHSLSAGGIIVLLAVMLAMNSVAIFIRHRSGNKNREH